MEQSGEPGRRRRFCSDQCRIQYHARKVAEQRQARAQAQAKTICPNCGKEFQAEWGAGKQRRFCNDPCRIEWWAAYHKANPSTDFAAGESTEPTEPGTVHAQPAASGTENAGEGTNTTEEENPSEGPQTALQTVSDLEELLQAIEQAEAGATIGVGCEIICPAGLVIGDNEKTIVLKRTAPEGRICFYSFDGTGNSAIQNMVLDGNFVDATTAFVQSSMETTFLNCTFSNCMAGAVEVKNGYQYFENCTFESNTAQYGPHIRFDGGSGYILSCSFTGGTATIRGGAIACYTDQGVFLEQSTVTGNSSGQRGGGIWNGGKLTILQSMIYGNEAHWEPDDIVNEYQGQLALVDNQRDLARLYAQHDLTPNKWAVDTFIDESAERPNMVFSMTFAANDPEPSPEPEPTPEPIPEPEPVIIYKTHVVEKLVKEPETEPATITNGKVVLKAPDGHFWTGYETGHGGAAGTVTRADLAALMLSMMDDESRERYLMR